MVHDGTCVHHFSKLTQCMFITMFFHGISRINRSGIALRGSMSRFQLLPLGMMVDDDYW